MYSTCLGLILKGYNDYENKRKKFEKDFLKVEVSGVPEAPQEEVLETAKKTSKRKTLKDFLDSWKIGLIDLFKEEEDAKL